MPESTQSTNLPPPLGELVDKLPAGDYATAVAVLEGILKTGKPGIRRLIAASGQNFGDLAGVQPKYAVHGLVHHASRPEADKERKLVAQALAEELAGQHSDALKAFICRQLQFCGGDPEVPALAALLKSNTLCGPATQALSATGSAVAVGEMKKALPAAKGEARVALTKALGTFSESTAAAEVRNDITASDAGLRFCAWYALGNMGDKASVEPIMKALDSESTYEQGQALDACLRIARELAESGDRADGEKICRSLLAKLRDKGEVHERLAVLAALADVAGVKASGALLEAMDSKDLKLRHHSAWTAVDLAAVIRKDHAAESGRLLKKVLDATNEESVRQKAQSLVAGAQEGSR
ncbi:MAG: hypothetical protein QGH15_04285 [Kiritimatiellia bacterium]|nr:hypothetical protein [Kiritimatiellia bacterium]